MKEANKATKKNLSFLQVAGSILASFFGVQKAKTRKRDFEHGTVVQFIVIGVLMTAVWYGCIAMIVSVVLRNAQ